MDGAKNRRTEQRCRQKGHASCHSKQRVTAEGIFLEEGYREKRASPQRCVFQKLCTVQRCFAKVKVPLDAQRADKNRDRGETDRNSLPELEAKCTSPRQAVAGNMPSFQLRHDPGSGKNNSK